MSEVRLSIGYMCRDTQDVINAGLNGFGAALLAESFADDPDKFPEGGVLFTCYGHSGVPVYVTVSLEFPEIVASPEIVALSEMPEQLEMFSGVPAEPASVAGPGHGES